MSYRDDVTGLRVRTSELERELAVYRAAGPAATDVRVAELTAQRANLASLARPYLWLLLEPLAWLLIHGGSLDAASSMDRLAVFLLPPALAVAHLAHALRQQMRAVIARRDRATAEDAAHATTMSGADLHAARAASLDADIREIGYALAHRRDALVQHSAGPGAMLVGMLIVSAFAAAMGTGHAGSFEPVWTSVAVLGFFGFLFGVAGLAARVGLADETPAVLHATPREEAAPVAPVAAASTPVSTPVPARVHNDYALELARHAALEAELATYRRAGTSAPAMRVLEIDREARAVASRWKPFTWLAFELALVALTRTHSLPLSLLDALLVPPGVVLAAFALHAGRQAVALQRRLAFALSERSVVAGAPRIPASSSALAVRAREAEERACTRSLRAGRRERRTSFLLFAGAAGAFLAAVGSLTPRDGAHGTMVLGMIIGVSLLTALAALGFLAFALVQVVHRRRLLGIAHLATRLERKKLQRLEHDPATEPSVPPELRLRVAVMPPSPPESLESLESLPSLDDAAPDSGDSAAHAALARHFA